VDDDILGPIDFLAVEFPNRRIGGDSFASLMQLVQHGIIQVLDLEFVARSADGTVQKVELDSIEHDAEVDVNLWQAAESGLLDASDIGEHPSDWFVHQTVGRAVGDRGLTDGRSHDNSRRPTPRSGSSPHRRRVGAF
jgi:hypothetical protein